MNDRTAKAEEALDAAGWMRAVPDMPRATFTAWNGILEKDISRQLAEMNLEAQGDLFTVNDNLRAAAAESGHPIPADTIHIVRWTAGREKEDWATRHRLTRPECEERHERCLSLLLDALTSEAPAAEEAETIRLLKKEWQSRNDAYRNAAS